MSLLLLILGLVLFIGLVVVHEWGHFIAARRNGVDVEEFGVGFPPKVYARRMKSGFLLSINALPLGGFVRLRGENDEVNEPRSFGAASLSTKIKIMVAGVAMNLIVAYILLVVLALAGMPKLVDNQFSVPSDTKITRDVQNKGAVLVTEVIGDSPAQKAGMRDGDRIISLAGSAVSSPEQVGTIAQNHKGEDIKIIVKRADQQISLQVKLNEQNQGQGYLGTVSESGQSGVELRRSTWSAPIVAGGVMGQFSQLTYKGLGTAIGNLFRGNTEKASEQVSGPVGIFVILKAGTSLGINFVLMLVAIISLTLAIINILPIPALDGGRLFVTLIYRAIKKPLSKRQEDFIHGAGFLALMLLFVLITIVDVKRFF